MTVTGPSLSPCPEAEGIRLALVGDDSLLLRLLASALTERGCAVIPLPGGAPGSWTTWLAGAHAIVHVVGAPAPVPAQDTPAARRRVIEPPLDAMLRIADALRGGAAPPRVWVHVGSAAFYNGGEGDPICDEVASVGEGWGAQICRLWEGGAVDGAATAGVRLVLLRAGLVMSPPDGGELAPLLLPLIRWRLGGAIRSGSAYLPWLHRDDLVGVVLWAIRDGAASGVYNATSPKPVRTAEFMAALRRACRRPLGLSPPERLIRRFARVRGVDPELILAGRRCIPTRLRDAAFPFRYSDLDEALRALYVG
jgi:hypothetical protein